MNGKRDGYTPGPRWVRVGSRGVLYLKEDLDRWLDTLGNSRAVGSYNQHDTSIA